MWVSLNGNDFLYLSIFIDVVLCYKHQSIHVIFIHIYSLSDTMPESGFLLVVAEVVNGIPGLGSKAKEISKCNESHYIDVCGRSRPKTAEDRRA